MSCLANLTFVKAISLYTFSHTEAIELGHAHLCYTEECLGRVHVTISSDISHRNICGISAKILQWGWHITCTTRRRVLEFDISSFDVNLYIKIVWKQPYKRSVLCCAVMCALNLTPGNDIPWIFSMRMRAEAIIHKSIAKMATAIVLKSLDIQLDSFSIHSC